MCTRCVHHATSIVLNVIVCVPCSTCCLLEEDDLTFIMLALCCLFVAWLLALQYFTRQYVFKQQRSSIYNYQHKEFYQLYLAPSKNSWSDSLSESLLILNPDSNIQTRQQSGRRLGSVKYRASKACIINSH